MRSRHLLSDLFSSFAFLLCFRHAKAAISHFKKLNVKSQGDVILTGQRQRRCCSSGGTVQHFVVPPRRILTMRPRQLQVRSSAHASLQLLLCTWFSFGCALTIGARPPCLAPVPFLAPQEHPPKDRRPLQRSSRCMQQ